MVGQPYTAVAVQQAGTSTPAKWSVTTTTLSSGGNQKAVTVSRGGSVSVTTSGSKGTLALQSTSAATPLGLQGTVETTPAGSAEAQKREIAAFTDKNNLAAAGTAPSSTANDLAVFGVAVFPAPGEVGTETKFDASLNAVAPPSHVPAMSPPEAAVEEPRAATSPTDEDWVIIDAIDAELPVFSRVSPQRHRVSITEHTPVESVIDELMNSMGSKFNDQLAAPPEPVSPKSPKKKKQKKKSKGSASSESTSPPSKKGPAVDDSMSFFEIVSAFGKTYTE